MKWTKLAAWPRRYLWQAPRGAVLKHTRNSDKILTNHVDGKSIAIIGNARSLFDAKYGNQIERHDIIVRLNKGFVKNPDAQGHSTDFWGLTPELSEDEIDQFFAPRVILFLIPKLRHLHIYKPENVAIPFSNVTSAYGLEGTNGTPLSTSVTLYALTPA